MNTFIILLVTAVINGIINSHAKKVRKAIVLALMILPPYALLVYFNEDSTRIFGGWLFERAEGLSILADFLPRMLVLAGMPVLAIAMLYAILLLLDEPKNRLYLLVGRTAKQAAINLFFFAAASVFIIGLDAIARESLDFALSLLGSVTLHNCVMAICLSGMMTGFMYLIFETYVAISTLPDLIKLLKTPRYKPKH